MNLPKGTRIDCLAHFDNSESNPYNPDPNKMVRWGEQTFEEMMIGYLDMDVPIGEPILHGPDFVPTAEKATMATFQALRRFVGGDRAKSSEPGQTGTGLSSGHAEGGIATDRASPGGRCPLYVLLHEASRP